MQVVYKAKGNSEKLNKQGILPNLNLNVSMDKIRKNVMPPKSKNQALNPQYFQKINTNSIQQTQNDPEKKGVSYFTTKRIQIKNATNELDEKILQELLAPQYKLQPHLIDYEDNQIYLHFNTVEDAKEFMSKVQDQNIQYNNKTLEFVYVFEKSKNNQEIDTPESNTLHVTFMQSQIPITTDLVLSLFGKFGQINKINIFTEKNIVALVQFQDIFNAKLAKKAYHAKEIKDKFTMKISYTMTSELLVNGNNSPPLLTPKLESRPFFSPDLQPNIKGLIQMRAPYIYNQHQHQHAAFGFQSPPNMQHIQNSQSLLYSPSDLNYYCNLPTPPARNRKIMQQQQQQQQYIGMMGSPPLPLSPQMNMNSPPMHMSPQLNQLHINQQVNLNQMNMSPLNMSPQLQPGSPFSSQPQFFIGGDPTHQQEEQSNLLIIKRLPKNITPDLLFKLFSVYGTVTKVKIFFKNPENALVEFQDSYQALLAQTYLNNCPFFGNNILVNLSKFGHIYPNIKSNEEGLLKDYTNSPDCRYKVQGSKNYKNIFAPSNMLHVANISENVDAYFIINLFEQTVPVQGFQFFKNDKKMALIQMNSVNDAVMILVKYHNLDVYGRFLKISFSNNVFHPNSQIYKSSDLYQEKE